MHQTINQQAFDDVLQAPDLAVEQLDGVTTPIAAATAFLIGVAVFGAGFGVGYAACAAAGCS